MKLNKLRIKNFRQFSDLSIDFDKGINVILGPNEAGKSTLSSAIMEALFTDPATKSKQFFERAYPWKGKGQLLFELELEDDLSRYKLTKDFRNKVSTLENLDTGEKTENHIAVQKALAQISGIPTREVYEATAFIGQNDIAKINSSSDLVSALQNAAGAGRDVNVQKLIDELQSKLKSLRVGLDRPANNPGQLKTLSDRVEHLTAELATKKQQWEKVRVSHKDAKSSSKKLDEITEKITVLEKLIENHKTYDKATKQIAELDTNIEKLEEQIKTHTEVTNRRKQVESSLVKFKHLEALNLDEIGLQLAHLIEAKKAANSELNRLRVQPANQAQQRVGSNPGVIVVPLLLLIAGGFLSLLLSSVIYVLGALVFAVIAFIAMRRGSRGQPGGGTQNQMGDPKMQVESRYRKSESELTKLLAGLKVANSNEFYTQKGNYLAVRENLKELDAHIEGLLAGRTIEDVRKEQIGLLQKKKEIEVNQLTDEVKNSKLSSEEYLRKRRELDLLYLEKKRNEEKSTVSKVRAEESGVDADQITSLEEQLEFSADNLAYLREQEKVVELVINTLTESVAGTAQSAGDLVSKEIEKYLPALTRKRYSDARLTDSMGIEVFAREKNDWVDPIAVLSKGTVDQIYFLARFALLKTMLKNRVVPLVIDDAFVTFDHLRTNEVKKMLEKISKKFQVIVLTHNNEYQSWGRLIKLPGQKVQRSSSKLRRKKKR
ncbi:MAG: ATP-binding protein [Candidatus Dojkabacteria bacterium]